MITDDPKADQIPLTITGRVIGIYTLSAKSVKLTGTVGETIKETIRLTPGRDFPFTVEKVTAKKGESIRFQLEEIRDGEDVHYDLTVENISTKPGVYFDTLRLETDSETKPEINISVVGRINPAETAQKKEARGAAGDL